MGFGAPQGQGINPLKQYDIASDPDSVINLGQAYWKDTGSGNEFFLEDESGNVTQVTETGRAGLYNIFTNGLYVTGGDVGIGPVSPVKNLHVSKASGEATLRLQSGTYYSDILQSGKNLFIQCAPVDGNIIFYDDASERMRIDTDGNVGISTNSPDCKLHVAGAAAFSGPSETFVTFGSSDTTPSVATGNLFKTHASGQTLTTFDDGVAGQTITVISTAAVVFDVTSTTLKGGSTNITTASGDVTEWTYDGTNWYLQQFMDVSADMSSVGGGGGGGISSVETKTGNYTADTDDDVILCNAAALTITLPAVSGNTGQTYYIKNIHATGVATIDADGSETIDGALKKFITTQYESLTIVCDGSNWHII